jgi:hypothetical protein
MWKPAGATDSQQEVKGTREKKRGARERKEWERGV